ncbi:MULTISPECIES: SDH family Clp fold serine proteinase [Aeromonas]|uniref:SDH family Clp fold serine proteinase n=1 Tax=Aeromonas TaxID=642 RepID=UPI001FD2EC9A|nr:MULTISPECIES: hypothetical protein [Aeromonas]MCJ7928886.1 hypothetical protein [Aeromonas sp. LsrichE-8G]HDX8615732.1 hypothetical protein [Aeromonas dhakensis]
MEPIDFSITLSDKHCDDGAEQSQQISTNDYLKRLAEYFSVEQKIDLVIYSGNIGSPADNDFRNALSKSKKNEKVILWLSTYGGVPDSAYRMGRALQSHYNHITVYVDRYCKSSGTLLALAADEICMSESGEFGPLDIQLLNKEEFYERNSGLDSFQALSTLAERSNEIMRSQFMDLRMGARLSTKQALDAATKVTIGLLSPIYEQLEPMRLGEVHRSMQIAYEYGNRLNKGILKQNALSHLIAQYPSHSYVIDRIEAEDRLFSIVTEPGDALVVLSKILSPIVDERIANSAPLLVHLNDYLKESDDKHDCVATQEDAVNEDAVNEDAVNEDAVNEDAVNEDAVNEGVVNVDAENN